MNVPHLYVVAFNFTVLIPLAAFWILSARRGPPTDFTIGVFAFVAGLVGIADAVMLSNDLFFGFMPGLFGVAATLFGARKLVIWKRNDEFQRR